MQVRNDKCGTRYMDDQDFQNSAFPILSREIFKTVRAAVPAENPIAPCTKL